jgi:alpha-L-fucosidase 2
MNHLIQPYQSSIKILFREILFLLFTLSILTFQAKGQSSQKKGDWGSLKLVNSQPTERKSFAQAFPIGNGRLGAKVFGGVASEVLCLNESTLWSGMPTHYEKPGTPEILALLRKALMEGDYKKGDELARQLEGKNNESYQPLGNLYLNFPNHDTYSNYRNTLDLDRAMVITKIYGSRSKLYPRNICKLS